MKILLPAIALVFYGCQEPAIQPTASSAQTSPAPKTEEPVPVVQQTKDPMDKVERIHQLRELATRKITFGAHILTVWIMDDASKRQEGMMWLVDKDVKDTEGMLFVFQKAEPRSFWMQNCPLGLDITYLDPNGKVLNVGVGKPYDESGVPSKGSAQYVLELKTGMAKKFGIQPGSVLKLPKDVKSQDGE
ncbi:MAG TPA: DUF192 domain-containing protein [Fimbriimonadaceae bacterium]|nr:DUF192 domain-containing protein [Fimbriimonadaceae bacterium]